MKASPITVEAIPAILAISAEDGRSNALKPIAKTSVCLRAALLEYSSASDSSLELEVSV